MRKSSRNWTGNVVGLDLGDRSAQLCEVDTDREVVRECSVWLTYEALSREFEGAEPKRVVLETGGQSDWIAEFLENLGHEVVVVNPRELALLTRSKKKTDREDARLLARLGVSDLKLLKVVEPRPRKVRVHRAELKSRDALVSARAMLVNHVRGTGKAFGTRIPSCASEVFHKRAPAVLETDVLAANQPLLKVLAELTQAIADMDECVEARCKEYPVTSLLQTVSGVGPVTSLAYVLTIMDPKRFEDPRAVGSYVGLAPRQLDSGAYASQLGISKAGDEMLRRLLVGSAQCILARKGRDSDLRRWGMTLRERGGKNGRKRAVVAVARKLAVLLLRLWRRGEVYEPLLQAKLALSAPAPLAAG